MTENARELLAAATHGHWEASSSEVTMNDKSEWRIGPRNRPQVARSVMSRANAELITHLVNHAAEYIEAREAVARLREVHRPYLGVNGLSYCEECTVFADIEHVLYPCDTIRTIEAPEPPG